MLSVNYTKHRHKAAERLVPTDRLHGLPRSRTYSVIEYFTDIGVVAKCSNKKTKTKNGNYFLVVSWIRVDGPVLSLSWVPTTTVEKVSFNFRVLLPRYTLTDVILTRHQNDEHFILRNGILFWKRRASAQMSETFALRLLGRPAQRSANPYGEAIGQC